MSKRLASLVVVALVVVAGLGVLIGRQTAPSTTSTSTSTTTTVLTAQPVEAVWPFAATAARFTDPLTAAFSFAHDYLGMTQPLLGAFQRGDSRSGEFSLRANATGPVTTVMVRQLTADNTWWVIGAACADIVLTTPSALASITSPVLLTGRSTAFEAVVNVELRQDASLTPIVRTTVMGGGNGVMGRFTKNITFTRPSAQYGSLVFRTLSAKDGSVMEASVLRIAFGA